MGLAEFETQKVGEFEVGAEQCYGECLCCIAKDLKSFLRWSQVRPLCIARRFHDAVWFARERYNNKPPTRNDEVAATFTDIYLNALFSISTIWSIPCSFSGGVPPRLRLRLKQEGCRSHAASGRVLGLERSLKVQLRYAARTFHNNLTIQHYTFYTLVIVMVDSTRSKYICFGQSKTRLPVKAYHIDNLR